MNLIDYQRAAIRTAKWFPSLLDNLEHAALGTMTEGGEFATVVKRVEIYGKEMLPEMRANALEELGDTYWYVALGCEALGTTIEKCKADLDGQDIDKIITLKSATLALGGISGALGAVVAAMRQADSLDMVRELPEFFGIASLAIDKCIVMLGANPDDVRADNIAKLRARYPEKYSDDAAEARADKGGLDARQS